MLILSSFSFNTSNTVVRTVFKKLHQKKGMGPVRRICLWTIWPDFIFMSKHEEID